jgi:hypothetical protein
MTWRRNCESCLMGWLHRPLKVLMRWILTAALAVSSHLYGQAGRTFEAASVKLRPNSQGVIHFAVSAQ